MATTVIEAVIDGAGETSAFKFTDTLLGNRDPAMLNQVQNHPSKRGMRSSHISLAA